MPDRLGGCRNARAVEVLRRRLLHVQGVRNPHCPLSLWFADSAAGFHEEGILE